MTLYFFSREHLGWTVRAHDPLQAKLLVEDYLHPLLADPFWLPGADERVELDFEPGDARPLPPHEGRLAVLDTWKHPSWTPAIWMWR